MHSDPSRSLLIGAIAVLAVIGFAFFVDEAGGHTPNPEACRIAWERAPAGTKHAERVACEQMQSRHRLEHACAKPRPIVRGITVKHVWANTHQRAMVTRVLNEGRRHRATAGVQIALIVGITQESTATNLTGGDRDSVGLLQARSMHGTITQRRNPEWITAKFLVDGFTGTGGAKSIARRNPTWRPGRITQAVQGSGHPHAYHQWEREARHTYARFLGACPR